MAKVLPSPRARPLSCLVEHEARRALLPAVPQLRETVAAACCLADHEASPQALSPVLPGQWRRCLISMRRHDQCITLAVHASVWMRQDNPVGGRCGHSPQGWRCINIQNR